MSGTLINYHLRKLAFKEMKSKKQPAKRLTANQQLLILHYLGILDNFKFSTNEKMHALFHLIIDKNKQAVKDFMTYRFGKDSKAFNQRDLTVVHGILLECGLTEIADKVKLELDKFE
jgi:hypothetical protein